MKAISRVLSKAEHPKPDLKYLRVKGKTVNQKPFKGIEVYDGI
jgi:hypothetical protein